MLILEFYLRDTETGKTGIYKDEYKDSDGVEFMWEEGNYACDCNRADFLYGESPIGCGTTRIALDKVVRVDDQKVVYDGKKWSW